MSRGMLITIEGMEGAGKGTTIRWSKEYLASYNLPLIWSREPGGTALGEAVRKLLLNNNFNIGWEAELLLCLAGRAQHLAEVIRPALAKGMIVICDRFTDSSYAYQGYARGGQLDKITRLAELVQGELQPDFTLLLDVPVEVGMKRVYAHRRVLDRIEREQYDFFERVVRGYREMAARFSDRYYVVNANCSRTKLHQQLRNFWQRVIKSFTNEVNFDS